MPKVNLGQDARRTSELRTLIRRYQGRDFTDATCAAMAKVSTATYSRRMCKKMDERTFGVGNLSVLELMRLQRGLGIPGEEICKVLFG